MEGGGTVVSALNFDFFDKLADGTASVARAEELFPASFLKHD